MSHIHVMEPLAQMLNSIEHQKRTGLLQIEQVQEGNRESGEIYFEHGHPVRARTEREAGQQAFHSMSKWKQITCAFQSMSRPYPRQMFMGAQERETGEHEKLLIHALPVSGSQTGKLSSYTHVPIGEQLASETLFPLAAKQSAPDPDMQLTELIDLDRIRSTIQPVRSTQPLILRGNALEKLPPIPLAKTPAAIRRWTTQLLPEIKPVKFALAENRLLPSPSSEDELKPGRLAIFKAKAMVMTTHIIQLMERRERIIFILLDGERTIQHIARLTHHTESEVERILLKLMKNGYTEYIRG